MLNTTMDDYNSAQTGDAHIELDTSLAHISTQQSSVCSSTTTTATTTAAIAPTHSGIKVSEPSLTSSGINININTTTTSSTSTTTTTTTTRFEIVAREAALLALMLFLLICCDGGLVLTRVHIDPAALLHAGSERVTRGAGMCMLG